MQCPLTVVVVEWRAAHHIRVILHVIWASKWAHAPWVSKEVVTPRSQGAELFHPSFLRSPVLKPNLGSKEYKRKENISKYMYLRKTHKRKPTKIKQKRDFCFAHDLARI